MQKRIALIAISVLVVAGLFHMITTRQLRAVAQENGARIQLERAISEDAQESIGAREEFQLIPFVPADVVANETPGNPEVPAEVAGVAQPAEAVAQTAEPDAVDAEGRNIGSGAQSVPQLQQAGGAPMADGIPRKGLQIQSFRLKNLRASNVKEMLGLLFPSDAQRGPFYASEPTGNILVIKGEGQALSEITQLLQSLGESGRPNAMYFQNTFQQQPPGSPTIRNSLGNPDVSSMFGRTEKNDAREAQQQLNAQVNLLEAQARLAAAVAQQQTGSGAAKSNEIAALKEKLRSVVAEEFQLRQELQQRDLELLRRRLEAVEDRLQRREAMQERIIDARIRELLGRTSDRKDRYGRMMSMMQDEQGREAADDEDRDIADAEEVTRLDDDFADVRNELIRKGFATQNGRSSLDLQIDPNTGDVAENVDHVPNPSQSRLKADLEIRRRLGEAEIALRQTTTRVQRLEKLYELGDATVEELEETQLEQQKAALAHEELKRLSEYQKRQAEIRFAYAKKALEVAENRLARFHDLNSRAGGVISQSEVERQELEVDKLKLQLQELDRLRRFLTGEEAESGAEEEFEDIGGESQSMLDLIREYGKSAAELNGALELWRSAVSLGHVAADIKARKNFFDQKSRFEKQLSEMLQAAEAGSEANSEGEDVLVGF